MLMVSLVAMSVAVASADIARPPCRSQIRADDMCHAPVLPGTRAEAAKKPVPCFACLLPMACGDEPAPPVADSPAPFGRTVSVDACRTVPWRPPRV